MSTTFDLSLKFFGWKKGIAMYEEQIKPEESSKSSINPWDLLRRSSRVSVSLPAQYRIYRGQRHTPWRSALVQDMSEHGVRLALDNKTVSIGTQLEVQFEMPKTKKTLLLKGEVVWAKVKEFPSGESRVECGVAFESSSAILQENETTIYTLTKKRSKILNPEEYPPAYNHEDLMTAYKLFYKEYSINENTTVKTDKKPELSIDPWDLERKSSRVSVSLPIQYRVRHWRRAMEWSSAMAKDMSQNGIRIALDQKTVSIGTKLEVQMQLPNTDKKLCVKGVVIWAKTRELPSGKNTVECGVALENFQKATRRDQMIHFFANKISSVVKQYLSPYECRPAQNDEELKKAYQLIYKEYSARGYCDKNTAKIYYNHFALLPKSRAFILLDKKTREIVGTISLIIDSPAGLPLDSLFKKEINACRKTGRLLAEVGLLSVSKEVFGTKSFSMTSVRKLTATFQLFKMMFDYANHAGVTDLIIGMHPKHKGLYEYLKFNEIGPVRSYPGACGNLALPMRLNITQANQVESREKGPGYYFLNEPEKKEVLEKYIELTPDVLEQFFFKILPLWPKLTDEIKAYLKLSYPSLAESEASYEKSKS